MKDAQPDECGKSPEPITTDSGSSNPPRERNSSSRKPASSFRPRLSRTLKRRAKQRPIEDRDWPYLYAAVKLGAFAAVFDRIGIDPAGKEEIEQGLRAAFEVGDTRILIAKTAKGRIPVGVIVAGFDGLVMEPHVIWFPWAKPRNKLETVLRYITDRRHDATLVIKSEYEFKRFWELIARYGVLRRVGNIEREGLSPLTIWQGRLPRKEGHVSTR